MINMEPIISPWMIYLINLAPNIWKMLCTLAGVCVCISVCAIFCRLMCTDDRWETPEQHKRNAVFRDKCFTVIKYLLPVGLVAFILQAFIPSRETMIAMVVANYITPDNFYGANEVIKSNLQDYINIIVEGINKVK